VSPSRRLSAFIALSFPINGVGTVTGRG